MRDRTIRLRSFCFGITISFVQPRAKPPNSVVRSDEEFVIPIREYAPLCLGEGLRRGKTIEVGRGSAPRKIYHTMSARHFRSSQSKPNAALTRSIGIAGKK